MKLTDRWNSIPVGTRESIKSFAVSVGFGSMTALGTLFSTYFTDHPNDWHGFGAYLLSPHSVGAVTVAIAAVYRARQGFRAATEVVVTSAATSVPNLPPK